MATDYAVLSVKSETKGRFNTFRRRLEAEIDRDVTEDELVTALLDTAGTPEGFASRDILADEQPETDGETDE